MSNPRRPAVPGAAPRDTLDGLRGVLRFVREQLYLDDEDEHPLTDACYAAMRALKASPDEPRGEAGDSTPPPPADNEPRCMRCNEERMLGHGVCVNCHDAVREALHPGQREVLDRPPGDTCGFVCTHGSFNQPIIEPSRAAPIDTPPPPAEPEGPCPHSRPSWKMCPHCNGVNNIGVVIPTLYGLALLCCEHDLGHRTDAELIDACKLHCYGTDKTPAPSSLTTAALALAAAIDAVGWVDDDTHEHDDVCRALAAYRAARGSK